MMQRTPKVEMFLKAPPLDLATQLFVTMDACADNPEAMKKLLRLQKAPSKKFNLTISQLEAFTKLCLQEGIIPKEPYEECILTRAKLFTILTTYGEDDFI